MTARSLRSEELEFLPAALEILESPPSPAGHLTMLVIMMFFSAAVAWSVYARVDVVAVAHGRIVPIGNVKIVQPIDSGIVRAIHVEDGQRVSQGQALIDLDPALNAADAAGLREQIARLGETLQIVTQRASATKELVDQDLVPRSDYLELEQQRIALEKELGVHRHELAKSTQRERWQRLTAPVSGVVQQLAVHTVGGVVTPAEALMKIVPEGERLEVDAYVENKDVGFVHAGQPVELKVETFPFTKYGTIDGELVSVSNDAIQDEKLGLVYAARVAMSRSTMNVEGRTVNLTPGMAMTVEIKTGRRRVIEYLLSPMVKRGLESGRER
jgi:hemolysin D